MEETIVVDEKQKLIDEQKAEIQNQKAEIQSRDLEIIGIKDRIKSLEAQVVRYRQSLEFVRDNMVHGNENHVKKINDSF